MTASLRSKAKPQHKLNEDELFEQIRSLAKVFGWLLYHPRFSLASTAGWPDVALCRPPRLVLAELKSMKGELRPDQATWLSALGQCPGVETFLWKPTDIDEIARILR